MTYHELIFRRDTLNDVVQELYPLFAQTSVFALSGPLGAGKTTLIQALLRNAGVEDPIQSPTFTTLCSYSNARGETFYHFDLYRMKNPHEFIVGGFDEYFYEPNSWCFIEWPEVISSILPPTTCHIIIDYHGEETRRLRYGFLNALTN